MASKFGIRSNPFVATKPLDSKTSVFIQVVDVIAGAVGYHWNQLHLVPGASKARLELPTSSTCTLKPSFQDCFHA